MYKDLANYNKYTKDFPVQSELRKKKLEELKSQLATQQSISTKPNTRGKAAKSLQHSRFVLFQSI